MAETTVSQNIPTMDSVSMGTTRRQAYASAAQAMGGDAFGAIIQQMLLQMTENQTDSDTSDPLAALAGQNSKTAKEQLEQMLAQGATGILQNAQPMLELLQETAQAEGTAQDISQLSALMGQDALAGMQSVSQVPENVLETLLLLSDKNTTAQPVQMQAADVPAAAGNAAAATAEPVLVVRQASSGEDSAFAQLMQEDTGSGESASEASLEAMQNSKNRTTELLAQEQASVPAESSPVLSLSETAMAKAEAMSREPQLLQQLESTINETLSTGKQELTMKLKPEALGEITVRLVEQDGKMTLDITAANSQTAKLINSDIAALREAVRPMNVEVHEAVQQSGHTAEGTAQYELFGQQFSNQQQFAGRQSYPQENAHYGRQGAFEKAVSETAEEQAVPPVDSLSDLDTYV